VIKQNPFYELDQPLEEAMLQEGLGELAALNIYFSVILCHEHHGPEERLVDARNHTLVVGESIVVPSGVRHIDA
jgi:hypothetical protein